VERSNGEACATSENQYNNVQSFWCFFLSFFCSRRLLVSFVGLCDLQTCKGENFVAIGRVKYWGLPRGDMML
jgi:hypothetical protein